MIEEDRNFKHFKNSGRTMYPPRSWKRAGIADGTTASIVASGADWKSLVQVGMTMGVTAGAMGNYVGIGVAYLVKMLAGV